MSPTSSKPVPTAPTAASPFPPPPPPPLVLHAAWEGRRAQSNAKPDAVLVGAHHHTLAPLVVARADKQVVGRGARQGHGRRDAIHITRHHDAACLHRKQLQLLRDGGRRPPGIALAELLHTAVALQEQPLARMGRHAHQPCFPLASGPRLAPETNNAQQARAPSASARLPHASKAACLPHREHRRYGIHGANRRDPARYPAP